MSGESDRDIKQWEQRLANQVTSGWDNYKHVRIDLSTARADEPFGFVGEFLYIEQSSSSLAVAKIKFNRSNNPALDLEKHIKVETLFIEVFITNEALDHEWLDLVFGINFKYYREREPATEISILEEIRDELQGDVTHIVFGCVPVGVGVVAILGANPDRKGLDLQAALSNVGIIYIGYDPTVTAVNTLAALAPGMSFTRNNYRGEIYAIASVAAQLLNVGVV